MVTACGSESGSATGEESAGTSGESATSSATSGKLSANNASQGALVAAFEAAGIENAEQWAHKVEEYRPYPEYDTDFAKLRGELANTIPVQEWLTR